MTTEQCWEMVYPLGDTRRCRNQARAGKATCYLHAPSESSIAWRLTSPKDEFADAMRRATERYEEAS